MSDTPVAVAVDVDNNTFSNVGSPPPNNNNKKNSPTTVSSPNSFAAQSNADASPATAAAERRTLIRRIVTGGAVIVLLVLFSKASAATPYDIFFYHPTSMTIAFLGLMPEAISLAMQAKQAASMNKRGETIQCHALVSLGFKIAALAGYAAIWKSKQERGKAHYTTWHGKLGLLAGLVLVAQVFLGALQFWPFSISSSNRVWCRKLHRWLGTGLVAASGCAFLTGFESNYALRMFYENDIGRLVAGLSCIVAALFALFRE